MRTRPALLIGCAGVGFLAGVVAIGRPAVPPDRLPQQFVLANLIDKQQQQDALLRRQVEQLRHQIDALQTSAAGQKSAAASTAEDQLRNADLVSGLTPVEGPGVRVVLDDSDLTTAPSGDINDLVIHSQDVQAAVNALWRSGAEAVAINGERLVATSAVLCVGNTLLLNGTVHSPPYIIEAVGAAVARFEADPLVRRLHSDATTFRLRFSVDDVGSLVVPAYGGAITTHYARSTG